MIFALGWFAGYICGGVTVVLGLHALDIHWPDLDRIRRRRGA